jgi:hypothetical protein
MAHIYTQVTLSNKKPIDLDDTFMLLTDSQDINAINEYFGDVCIEEDFNSFFVRTYDGDYDRVYGCHYSVPCNNDRLYLVEMIHS